MARRGVRRPQVVQRRTTAATHGCSRSTSARTSPKSNAARWVRLLMQRSAREAGLPNDAEFASVFRAYFEWGSRLAVENSQA